MKTRPLGQSGIEASVVGLGCWAIGGTWWGGTEEKKSIKAIQAAIDSGISLVDTAPIYGFGLSEEVVGKAIKGRRDKVVLATKCGLVWDHEGGDFFFEMEGKKVYKHLARDSMREEVEKSLKRLGVDCIDLLQTHWQESTTPQEETEKALLELKQEGKIRAIGVSNVNVAQLEAYRSAGPVDSAQEKYSMIDRKLEEELLPYCRDNNIAMLAYSPLALGLLTGKIGPEREFKRGDQRKNQDRFSVENRKKVLAMLADLAPVAEKHKLTMAQLVIAWTAQQPGVTHVLCGARDPEQAEENAAAGEAELTAEDIAAIDKALAKHSSGIK